MTKQFPGFTPANQVNLSVINDNKYAEIVELIDQLLKSNKAIQIEFSDIDQESPYAEGYKSSTFFRIANANAVTDKIVADLINAGYLVKKNHETQYNISTIFINITNPN